MKISIPKLNAECFFGMFLALFWGQNILFKYVRAIIIRIPYIKYLGDYIVPSLMILCLLCALPYLIKGISYKDILFTGIVFSVVLSNILLFPENESLISLGIPFFLTIFPLYFIGLKFETSKHFRILYIMSIINIWAFGMYYLMTGGGSVDVNQGEAGSYMGRAYVLLPQLLIVFNGTLKKKNILNIVTSVFGFLNLLMCGNRGSIVISLLYIAIYLFFNIKGRKSIYFYVGVCTVLGTMAYYYNRLFIILMSFFEKMGLSTRVFDKITEGTFFESHGRNLIIEKLKIAIWENPIVGYGLCSDRTITGSYAHNFAFELWTAFGVIFGTIILMATVCIIYTVWIKTKDAESRGFLLGLICVGFFKLFISNSFLEEGLFFMLLGVSVMQLRKSKFAIQ